MRKLMLLYKFVGVPLLMTVAVACALATLNGPHRGLRVVIYIYGVGMYFLGYSMFRTDNQLDSDRKT